MRISFIILALLLIGCKKTTKPDNEARPFTASGLISSTVEAFRTQLGSLNTVAASSGRREINWDGVPDSLAGLRLPADFFNPTTADAPLARKRGILYAGSSRAAVSKADFAEVNSPAAGEFAPFSGNKTFAVTNALEWPVEFRVPGQTTPATINAFGAVFVDVDKANSTYIEFFNSSQSLGRFFVPVQQAGSKFSFLGVYFPQGGITRVQIGHEGRLADGDKDVSQGGAKDLVILDDFIYSEPQQR